MWANTRKDYWYTADYNLDKMNQESFAGTEATLMLMTVVYNFLSLFKQIIMGGNVQN